MKTILSEGYNEEFLYFITGAKPKGKDDTIRIKQIHNDLCFDKRGMLCQLVEVEHSYRSIDSYSGWSHGWYHIWLPVPKE